MIHRLKSLELHGYKTFANRTYFEFADTITAIVGPNGSGKSNIADSIRWVLGEQSYGLLRARKTEDMIFSGSESRARAGMASATITFDNSEGWLPIDFSEVAITRRAHRDGLNEYLINGQRIRLRDVSELLAESGLAERTYTVIGQGLVDATLSLRADERRRLFEEAAGIGLHRSRREESLRRLETTRRNLERVEDILAELKPRLSSLERQARRALEYEQARLDLQVLLREWYGYHWHEAQKELAEAQDVSRVQEIKLLEARHGYEISEAKLSELREGIRGLRQELNSRHQRLSELHTLREGSIHHLATVEERIRSLLTQQQNDQRDLDRNLEEESFFHEQVAAARQEIVELASELDEARLQFESAHTALTKRLQDRSEIETSIQSIRQTLSTLNTQQGILQAQYGEAQSQASRIGDLLEAAQGSLTKAEEEQKNASSQLQTAQTASQKAAADLQSAEASLAVHRRSIEEVARQLVKEREQHLALTERHARLKAELDVLDQAEAALTGYASGARLLLQAARQNRLSGARGSLNAFLEVPPEYEKAIAAVLGDFLDAVLLDINPDHALDLLEKGAGRGALLPLSDLKPEPRPMKPIATDDQIFGEAADLVSAPAELRGAVDLLLRGVIVVKDRASARRCLAAQPSGVRAVTLRGDVYYAAGPILSSGSEAGDNNTLLGRARQRRDTQTSASKLHAQILEGEEEIASLMRSEQDLKAEETRLFSVLEARREEVLKAGRALDQSKSAVEQAERQVSWRREQLQNLRTDHNRRRQEIDQIIEEISRLEKKITSARGELREQNACLEELSLDEFQSDQAHWTTRLAVAERALTDAHSRLAERSNAYERLQQNRIALQERLSNLTLALSSSEEEKAAAQRTETELAEQIQALNMEIHPAETQLIELEHRQAEEQNGASLVRQQVSAAEHLQAQARINLVRRNEVLQSLQRRIEDDFGLVAYEYVTQVSGPNPLPLSGLVEQLPNVESLPPELEENIRRQRLQLRRIGPINPEAQAEYHEVHQRYEFLIEQVADLQKAEEDIRQVIAELDELMQREFRKTFDAVAVEFHQIFSRLFGGGSARLILTDSDDLTTTGIEIEARLPGRRTHELALLSGGERSLTAVSLVFALLSVSPTPFCVLDEVDAMLDEANIGRFRDLLCELSQNTQFLIVTHNRNTVQVADVIYGVTMGKDSSSQTLSLKLDEVGRIFE